MNPFLCDHDMHTHTILSACCYDGNQTVDNIVQHAKENHYSLQAITDHVWDSAVKGASNWYAPQDIAHIKQALPLRTVEGMRVVFGCETEFLGGEKLGLHPAHFDEFDFIIIPPNHFHMAGFVRPLSVDTPQKIADLLVRRLEEIAALPLPFHKIGIAHLTTGLINKGGDKYEVIGKINQERFFSVMRLFAKNGAGIELNGACFLPGWQERAEEALILYHIAKQADCKFYLGSDAHTLEKLDRIPQVLPEVVKRLNLNQDDRFDLP